MNIIASNARFAIHENTLDGSLVCLPVAGEPFTLTGSIQAQPDHWVALMKNRYAPVQPAHRRDLEANAWRLLRQMHSTNGRSRIDGWNFHIGSDIGYTAERPVYINDSLAYPFHVALRVFEGDEFSDGNWGECPVIAEVLLVNNEQALPQRCAYIHLGDYATWLHMPQGDLWLQYEAKVKMLLREVLPIYEWAYVLHQQLKASSSANSISVDTDTYSIAFTMKDPLRAADARFLIALPNCIGDRDGLGFGALVFELSTGAVAAGGAGGVLRAFVEKHHMTRDALNGLAVYLDAKI